MLPAYDTSTATRHLRTFWKFGLFGRVKTNSPRSKVLRVGHNHHPCTANSKAHHRKQLDDLAGMEVAIWAKGVKLCRTCRMLPTSCLPCKVLRLTYLKPAKSLRHCQVVNGEKKRFSKKWWTIILPLMNEIINNSTKECDQTCLPAFCSNSNYHHSSSFIIICHVSFIHLSIPTWSLIQNEKGLINTFNHHHSQPGQSRSAPMLSCTTNETANAYCHALWPGGALWPCAF